MAWIAAAGDVLRRISDTQEAAIAEASAWCAEAIAGGGLVHLFGTGHSRIPVEEMFPRYGSLPGLQPDRRAVDDVPHRRWWGRTASARPCSSSARRASPRSSSSNFTFGPADVMIVFSASGLTAVPVELARGARAAWAARHRGDLDRSSRCRKSPDPDVGGRLLDEADLVIDLCTPHADALVEIDGLDTPVGPGSTIAAVAIVNCHQGADGSAARRARAMPPVITRASVVGAERSRSLFDDAYREHAQRVTRAIGGARADGRGRHAQEVRGIDGRIGPRGAGIHWSTRREWLVAHRRRRTGMIKSRLLVGTAVLAVVAAACSSSGGTPRRLPSRRRPSRRLRRRRLQSQRPRLPRVAVARTGSVTRTEAASATASARSRSAPPRPRHLPPAR